MRISRHHHGKRYAHSVYLADATWDPAPNAGCRVHTTNGRANGQITIRLAIDRDGRTCELVLEEHEARDLWRVLDGKLEEVHRLRQALLHGKP